MSTLMSYCPSWLVKMVARILCFPSLGFNILLAWLRPKNNRWYDRVDDHVVIGALPFYWHVQGLHQDYGIRGVINTCEEYSGPVRTYNRFGIRQLHLPIVDYSPPTMEQVVKGVDFIFSFVERDESVLVHCKAGKGRSATMVLCYLIKKQGLTPDKAQALLLQKRPAVNKDLYRRKVVKDFYEKVRQKQN